MYILGPEALLTFAKLTFAIYSKVISVELAVQYTTDVVVKLNELEYGLFVPEHIAKTWNSYVVPEVKPDNASDGTLVLTVTQVGLPTCLYWTVYVAPVTVPQERLAELDVIPVAAKPVGAVPLQGVIEVTVTVFTA